MIHNQFDVKLLHPVPLPELSTLSVQPAREEGSRDVIAQGRASCPKTAAHFSGSASRRLTPVPQGKKSGVILAAAIFCRPSRSFKLNRLGPSARIRSRV